MQNEKRLPGTPIPGNLLTWSAAGSSSPEDHADRYSCDPKR